MGEVAEDMVTGCCCSMCGVYFVDAHMCPVLCVSCWKDASDEEKKEYRKAHLDEL